jgi:hypothetical protein
VHVLTFLLFISTVFGTVATAAGPGFDDSVPEQDEPPHAPERPVDWRAGQR